MHIKKQVKEENIRELFLKEFSLHLIKNMKIEEVKNFEQVQEIIPEKPLTTITQIKTLGSQKQMRYGPSIYERPLETKPQKILPRVPLPSKQQIQKTQISGLPNIMQFLNNRSIIGVESPGPDKPLLINHSGKIEATNLIMTKESIDEIMQEISKQTRIPLISGVFKAALGNYLVTAVISDFVGTRFAIQKRMPHGPPMYHY